MKIFREIKGIPEPEEEKKDEQSSEKVNAEEISDSTVTVEVETETQAEETSVCEVIDNEVKMPAESFEELFQMAKTVDESESEEVQDAETQPEIKGNYSKVSADKLWKDIK